MRLEGEPGPSNGFHRQHVKLLCRSYQALTGRQLIGGDMTDRQMAEQLYFAPFVVLSHDTAPDPVFNYANRMALELFEMSWDEMTALPSRHSAELPNQAGRASYLQRVKQNGFIENYSGIRISNTGKRFRIEKAVVWNLIEPSGIYRGQAARFGYWQWL
jgi:hypothetical protein